MRDREHLERDYEEYLNSEVRSASDGYYVGRERIMTFTQEQIMRRYAECVIDGRRDVILLEVGYGLGVFAEMAEIIGIREHVIIECHPKICALAKEKYSNKRNVKIIQNFWQNIIPEKRYDAIFYDSTVIGDEVDAVDELLQFIIFANEFLLVEGGVLSFWYQGDKIDSRILGFLQNELMKFEMSLYEALEVKYLVIKLIKY